METMRIGKSIAPGRIEKYLKLPELLLKNPVENRPIPWKRGKNALEYAQIEFSTNLIKKFQEYIRDGNVSSPTQNWLFGQLNAFFGKNNFRKILAESEESLWMMTAVKMDKNGRLFEAPCIMVWSNQVKDICEHGMRAMRWLWLLALVVIDFSMLLAHIFPEWNIAGMNWKYPIHVHDLFYVVNIEYYCTVRL